MEHNTEKLREMIKYITIRSQNDPNFGKTKLYKLVFFADFYAHKNLGTSISGQEYQKYHYGPVSEDIDQVYLDLINSREIAESIMDVFNYVKHRPVVLTKVDTAIFSKEEIFIMDDIIQEYYLMNGKQISNASHDVIPAWEERIKLESQYRCRYL